MNDHKKIKCIFLNGEEGLCDSGWVLVIKKPNQTSEANLN